MASSKKPPWTLNEVEALFSEEFWIQPLDTSLLWDRKIRGN